MTTPFRRNVVTILDAVVPGATTSLTGVSDTVEVQRIGRSVEFIQ
jgi:hypothetical protein